MKSFKEMREARMVASADFKISASGRKVHRMKKVADDSYSKEKDLDHDGDNDENDKKLAKESVELEEAVTVKKHDYSWGKMVTVHHGADTSYPLHPEHQAAIKKLKDGEKTSFKDETNSTVHAHREGDKVHLTRPKTSSTKTTVAHSHFNEAVETTHEYHLRQAAMYKKKGDERNAKYHHDRAHEWSVKAAHDETKKAEAEIDRKYRREDTNLEEAVDKQEQRFLQLARLGLVDKANVSKLRMAVDQLKADKLLTVQQRTLLLGVMMDLVDLVTGDDAVFQRVKMDVQKEGTEGSWKVETPWMKSKDTVTDKSGAKHTPQSRVRHLARLALKKQQAKNQSKE